MTQRFACQKIAYQRTFTARAGLKKAIPRRGAFQDASAHPGYLATFLHPSPNTTCNTAVIRTVSKALVGHFDWVYKYLSGEDERSVRHPASDAGVRVVRRIHQRTWFHDIRKSTQPSTNTATTATRYDIPNNIGKTYTHKHTPNSHSLLVYLIAFQALQKNILYLHAQGNVPILPLSNKGTGFRLRQMQTKERHTKAPAKTFSDHAHINQHFYAFYNIKRNKAINDIT